MDKADLARLASQVSQSTVVLFTGAGFSREAASMSGQPLPLSRELAEDFWGVAFPSTPFDEATTLGDAFEAAAATAQTRTGKLLQPPDGEA